MKKALNLLAGISVLAAASARAGTIVLTFEGLQDGEQILNYYDGGFGGNGSGAGPNYGITFGPAWLAAISSPSEAGPHFPGAPSMPTVAALLPQPGNVMDVLGGFSTGFSLFYTPAGAGTVDVYSGLDGMGSLLATVDFVSLDCVLGSSGPPWGGPCPWFPVGVSFPGTAKSVVFTGSTAFDNMTLGSSTPITPEPATLTLFGTLLGLAGLVRCRRA